MARITPIILTACSLFGWTALIRYITNVDVSLCYLLALIPTVAMLKIFTDPEPKLSLRSILGYMICAALLVLVALYRLHGPFNGLVTVGGGDAGNHIFITHLWATSDPHTYYGMTSTQAFFHFLSFVSAKTFNSIYILQSAVAILLVLSFFSYSSLLSKHLTDGGPTTHIELLSCTTLGYLYVVYFITPIVGYLQADGFYSLLWGVVPYLCAMFLFSTQSTLTRRLCALLLSVLIIRFTYVLNLADLMVSAALIGGWYAYTNKQTALRTIGALSFLGCLPAAIYLYRKLLVMHSNPGGYVGYNVSLLAVGIALTSLAVLAAEVHRVKIQESGQRKLLHPLALPLVFCLVSCFSILLYQLFGYQPRYYFHKFLYTPALICMLISTSYFAVYISRLKQLFTNSDKRRQGVSIITFLLTLTLFAAGINSSVRATQKLKRIETFRATRTIRRIRPLADLNIWNLAHDDWNAGYKFGGVLISSWPVSNLMNNALRYELGETAVASTLLSSYSDYQAGPKIASGKCYYWYGDRHEQNIFSGEKMSNWGAAIKYTTLNNDVNKSCQEFKRNFDGKGRTVCKICVP